jgi:hypothetical protein
LDDAPALITKELPAPLPLDPTNTSTRPAELKLSPEEIPTAPLALLSAVEAPLRKLTMPLECKASLDPMDTEPLDPLRPSPLFMAMLPPRSADPADKSIDPPIS